MDEKDAATLIAEEFDRLKRANLSVLANVLVLRAAVAEITNRLPPEDKEGIKTVLSKWAVASDQLNATQSSWTMEEMTHQANTAARELLRTIDGHRPNPPNYNPE